MRRGWGGTLAEYWPNNKHLFESKAYHQFNVLILGLVPAFWNAALTPAHSQFALSPHWPRTITLKKQQRVAPWLSLFVFKRHMNAFQAPGNVAVVIWYLWRSRVQVRARLHDGPSPKNSSLSSNLSPVSKHGLRHLFHSFFKRCQDALFSNRCTLWSRRHVVFDAECKTPLLTRCLFKAGSSLEA